mmetsp:Transcript_10705/g.15100  ORF Transcript_10705/g.15100 Transcript_10705/m.15100 type:complete len:179 (-) Transcript_10705:1644-2180(-)
MDKISNLTLIPSIKKFTEGLFIYLNKKEQKAIQGMWDEVCTTFINLKNNIDITKVQRKRDYNAAFDNVTQLEDRICAMAAAIGAQSGIHAKLGFPSLWHGVSKAFDKLYLMADNNQSIDIKNLEQLLHAKIKEHKFFIEVLSNAIKQISMQGLEQKIDSLEKSLEHVLVPTYETLFLI